MTGLTRAGVAAAAALPRVAAAQPADGWDHMRGWGMMWGGGWMMLLFWGAAIALAVLLFRRYGAASGASRADPLEILRERFARGEIDAAEFEARRRLLEKG